MLLILFSWIYILLISSIIGVSTNKFLGITKSHVVLTIIHGFFSITLLTAIWAMILPVNWPFHVFIIVLCCIFLTRNSALIITYYFKLINQYKKLNFRNKILFGIISLLILAQCASPPLILDNESYYIQTIKWLNQYGFVKGLVNLHVFLGQTSGWHLLQSAFSFSFLYDRFNDLSGLIVLLGNFYAFTHFDRLGFKKNSNTSIAIIALLPLLNVIFFQFISAPSPDVAIYILSLISVYQFVTCFDSFNKGKFLSLLFITLFMLLIKLTAALFLLLPIVLFKRYYIYTRNLRTQIFSLIAIVSVIILIKNSIISGNPLFPLSFVSFEFFPWSLPDSIASYMALYGKAYGYHMTPELFQSTSWSLIFKTWILAPGRHGVFNKLLIALIIFTPLIIYRFYNKKSYWLVYIIGIATIILLFITSPQYRFFFTFLLIFGLMFIKLIIVNKRLFNILLILTVIISAIPLFFNINNNPFTSKNYFETTNQFSLKYMVQPSDLSNSNKNYKIYQEGNLKYYSPIQTDFFWGTGNMPLPALNHEQLEYFKKYFNIIPQQNSKNINDGFHSKQHLKK